MQPRHKAQCKSHNTFAYIVNQVIHFTVHANVPQLNAPTKLKLGTQTSIIISLNEVRVYTMYVINLYVAVHTLYI